MTIEEIDLYKLGAEDVLRYLPQGERAACKARSWSEFAQMLIDGVARELNTIVGKFRTE